MKRDLLPKLLCAAAAMAAALVMPLENYAQQPVRFNEIHKVK